MALNNITRPCSLDSHGESLGNPDPAATFYHLEAARLINAALKERWRAISDANIAAVTILANWQSFMDDGSKADHYISGLERMVSLRGGLEALPHPLAQRIQRVATNVAAARSVMPRFPLLNVQKIDIRKTIALPEEAESFNRELRFLGTGFAQTALLDVLSPKIRDILDEMQAIAKLFNLWTHGQANFLGLANDFFEMRIVALELRLLAIPYQSGMSSAAFVQDCCKIAGVLFVNTSFWLWRKWNKILEVLVTNLRERLQAVQWENCWDQAVLEVLLWVLFLGAHASKLQDQANWFDTMLVVVIERLGILSWEDAKKVLMTFIYWDAVHLQPFLEIWEEVQARRRIYNARCNVFS